MTRGGGALTRHLQLKSHWQNIPNINRHAHIHTIKSNHYIYKGGGGEGTHTHHKKIKIKRRRKEHKTNKKHANILSYFQKTVLLCNVLTKIRVLYIWRQTQQHKEVHMLRKMYFATSANYSHKTSEQIYDVWIKFLPINTKCTMYSRVMHQVYIWGKENTFMS